MALLTPWDYSMRIWITPERLTSYGLTPSDVVNALKGQNIQAAIGRIGAQPALPDQQFQLTIQTKGRLTAVEEFEGVVVKALPDGSFVRVRDVARSSSARAPRSRSAEDGTPAAVIGVYQSPGGNAIASAEQIRVSSKLRPSFPGVEYKITYDTTVFVEESIHEVVKTLLEAFALVVIVVYLFLGSVRATLIPLIAVPVSLIGTFAVMLALGFSANTVSLLALVLAIGIVVDDAIVVVEAVEHHLEKDPTITAAEAARRAMGEITAPIIAITLVLLSVFVPVAFIPGISGELFRQFAVAVSVSMVISAVNALTLSPASAPSCSRPATAPGADPSGTSSRHRPRPRRLCGGRPTARPHRRRRDRGSGGHHRRHGLAVHVDPTGFLPPKTRAPSSARSSCRKVHRSTAPMRSHSASRKSCAPPTASRASCRSSATACSTAR